MTETQRQIKELRKALPGLKEKVFGVALLLCLSLVMVASVSYAWVTMSTNPELGGVNTTVAANGALEIALSDFDGEEPEQSAAGDSFAAEGQTTHAANTSWGNLVNLSAGYGVDNLVLRPAKLDLTSPNYIYSVKYGQDGRVEGTFTDFGFTTWHQTDKTTNTWKFVAPSNYPDVFADGNAYGVRAISSVTYEGQEDVNVAKLRILAEDQAVVRSNYENNLIGSTENQKVIQSLVNQYLAHSIDEAAFNAADNYGVGGLVSNPGPLDDLKLSGSTYIPALTEMMRYFMEDIIIPAGETMVYAANLQSTSKTEYTLETLLAADRATLLKDGVKLAGLGYVESSKKYATANPYKTLYTKVEADYATMQGLWEANGQPKGTFTWKEIKGVVDHLIDINNVKIYDKNGKAYRVGYIVQDAGGTDEVLDLVNNLLPRKPDTVKVELVNGTLKEFEQLSGAAGTLPVEITAKKSILIISVDYQGDGRIVTNADHNNSYFRQDQTLTKAALDGAEDTRTLVAADTYGMILDLWVRTNAESSMLTLNGTPEVVERQEPVTVNVAGHDAPRTVYIYTYYTGQTIEVGGMAVEETQTLEVYEVYHDPDGDGSLPEDYYYYYTTDNVLAYEQEIVTQDGQTGVMNSQTLIHKNSVDIKGKPALAQKTITVYDVVGFTAANRIWQEDDPDRPIPGVGEISTTQGSGSCYIFHASSEEEYENTRNLLKNMRLVFLDENGNELSRARLDTDRIFAENGKYTVPLYIESYKEVIEDEEGNILATGLCRLEKNVARRISVLVYLEGENLENDMVMSAESVIGSLNLQFDSTADLHSVGDSELETEVITLGATIDKTSMEYNGQVQYAQLSAMIDGVPPQRVEATFVRMYSATQGTHCETIELRQGADGYWKAEIPFYSPGNYVLKVLSVDGVEYALPETIQVTVSGFDVSAAIFDTSAVLTVERRTTKRVTVQVAGNVLPKTVVAQFVSTDDKGSKNFVNVNLTRAGTNWTGDAVFTKSGQYTLSYLLMDGEPYSLPEGMQKSFMAYLGLTADVVLERYKKDASGNYITDEYGNYVIDTLNYEFTGTEDIYAFVRIYDDAGVPMDTLGTVTLYYKTFGSAIAQNGFGAELTWNGTDYAGVFPANRPGRFVFGELQLNTDNDQRITTARSAPELTVISTIPPSVTSLGDTAITYENGTAYYNLRIENAATANIWVVMNDGSQDHTVQMSATGETSYRAAFPDRDGDPNNGEINSNGNWTIKTVLFDNVYANDQFYVAGGEKYEIDIADEIHTIVNYLIVETASMQLGGTSLATATDPFMTAYNMSEKGLAITVRVPIGKADSTNYMPASVYAAQLSDAAVQFAYDGNSKDYGGYNGGKSTTIRANLTKATVGTDSVTFTIVDGVDVILQGAGKYAMTASVKLNNKSFSAKSGHAVEIYSKPVEAWIKDISLTPGSTINIDANKDDDNHTSGVAVPAFTRTEAVVYYSCSSTGGCGSQHNTTHPRVIMELSGLNSALGATATLAFIDRSGGAAHLYAKSPSSSEPKTQYTWSGSGECTRYVGTWVNKTGADDYTTAGTITANAIVITVGDNTYTFDVGTITIHNPSVQYKAGTVYDPT